MSLFSMNGRYPHYPYKGLGRLIRWMVQFWKDRVRPLSGSGQNGGHKDQV